MINQFAYHASQARTDDLRRAAAEARVAAGRRHQARARRAHRRPGSAWIASLRDGMLRAAVHGDRS